MLNIIRATSPDYKNETMRLFEQTGKLPQMDEGWSKSFEDTHTIHLTDTQLQWLSELEQSGCAVKLGNK
jgi:hypothetical protein